MSFNDKFKEAAAQAAVRARKAAEQAKELATEVKEQAEEKWAQEQQRRDASAQAESLAAPATDPVPRLDETEAPATQPINAPSSNAGPERPAKVPADPAALMAERFKGLTDRAAHLKESAAEQVKLGAAAARRKAPAQQIKSKSNDKAVLIGIGGLLGVGILLFGGVALAGGDDEPEKTATQSTTTSASATPTPSAEASAPVAEPVAAKPTVVDTTVDKLLNRLNSESIDGADGGLKTGDRFRISGPLFMSDLWGVGASGDYSVMFKAQGGKQDLSIFVNESDAEQWTDGTKVEMVVELVEVTIKGEKLNGFLRAVSVNTLSGATTAEDKSADAETQMFKDLEKFKSTFNGAFGDPPMISSIGPGSAPGVVYVQLHLGLLGVNVDAAQNAVTLLNEQLIGAIGDNEAFSNMVKYFIGREPVGENHAILDPYSVSFKGGLDD